MREADMSEPRHIYTNFVAIHPARQIAIDHGFEPTNRQMRKFGIPMTLFVRDAINSSVK
jgi:hypothetical protein